MVDNPFAQHDKIPAVSWRGAPVGAKIRGEVLELPASVQRRNFETKAPEYWPDGNPKLSVVTKLALEPSGEIKSLWAERPGALFAAIGDALKRAGAEAIEVGGKLEVTNTGEKVNPDKPHLNAQRQFSVIYVPPSVWANPVATQQDSPPAWANAGTGTEPDWAQGAKPVATQQDSPPAWSDVQIEAARQAGITLP